MDDKETMRTASDLARGQVIEGKVVGVVDGGAVVVTFNGRRVEARLPQHVDARWLSAAVAVEPVDVVLLTAGTLGLIVWGVLPGPKHAEVSVDLLLRGERVELRGKHAIEIRCGRSQVKLDATGTVEVRSSSFLSGGESG